ncbi:MAG: hypothetical protein AAGB25_04650, partial [Pseudomonadota bacterium]
MSKFVFRSAVAFAAALALGACAATTSVGKAADTASVTQAFDNAAFEQDRKSILAMTGDYKVTFDFTETVPFLEGYELKEPKLSGAHESV